MPALFVPLLVAALGAGPLQFTGSAGAYGEYGWVSGDSLVEPRPELRFSLDPTLSIYGLPLSFHALVSTQDNKLRQSLDQFRFAVGPAALLRQSAGVPSPLSFLSFVKGLELGTCHPNWTPYTLSGATLSGAAMEINPWYVYLAGAAGRSQRRVEGSDSTDPAYGRMLYSGRFGFGKKEGTHFFLTGMYATDDTTPLPHNRRPNPSDTTDTFELVQPKENYVLGAEFNLDVARGAFRLESEITGSEFTRDNRLPVERWDWLPEWAASTFKPRMSSSVDYAFKVRPALRVFDTRVYGKFEYVGPGYQSLGARGLRNDNTAIGGGIERSFFDNAVSLSVAYASAHDNLLAQTVEDSLGRLVRVLTLKGVTTRFTNWDASLGLAFPNLPYLQFGFYPYIQRSDSLDSMATVASTRTSTGNVVSVSAGHSFQTGKVSHSPGISFSYNDLRGPASDSADNTSWDAGLNYGLGFEFPLSLSVGCGYSRSEAAMDTASDSRLYFDLSPSYTLFQKWTNSLNVGGTFLSGRRIDARLTSSFPIWKICDASVSVIDALYNGDDGKYNDLRLTAQLSKSW
jgi:hypothetical protein